MNLKATALHAIALATLLGTAACTTPSQPSAKKEQAMPSVHSITSRYGFDDTVARLQASFLAKGMSIFGIINHQAAAQESGLSMQPATRMLGVRSVTKPPWFCSRSKLPARSRPKRKSSPTSR